MRLLLLVSGDSMIGTRDEDERFLAALREILGTR